MEPAQFAGANILRYGRHDKAEKSETARDGNVGAGRVRFARRGLLLLFGLGHDTCGHDGAHGWHGFEGEQRAVERCRHARAKEGERMTAGSV